MATIHHSRVIAAPADRVWDLVRSFDGIGRWLAGIPVPVETDGDPETVGTLRIFRDENGDPSIVERLVLLDDEQRILRYSIIESGWHLTSHLGEMRVAEQEDGTALVDWRAEFETEDPAQAETVRRTMSDTAYLPGLEGLAAAVEQL